MDEAGITNTVKTPHALARTSVKQVEKVVSAERGQLLTCLLYTSASLLLRSVCFFIDVLYCWPMTVI